MTRVNLMLSGCIVVLIVAIFAILFSNTGNKVDKKQIEETVNKIEQSSNTIKQNETTEAQYKEQIDTLNKTIVTLYNREQSIKKPTREVVANEVKDYNIYDVSNKLTSLGYPNTVICTGRNTN